jgi:hypothetical protein
MLEMKRIMAVDFDFEKKNYCSMKQAADSIEQAADDDVELNFVWLGLNAAFWRECVVYAIVLAALMLANSFLRLSNSVSKPSTQLDAVRHLFPHLNASFTRAPLQHYTFRTDQIFRASALTSAAPRALARYSGTPRSTGNGCFMVRSTLFTIARLYFSV